MLVENQKHTRKEVHSPVYQNEKARIDALEGRKIFEPRNSLRID